MKTLIAFSGGIDSTYVLWKQLTTTEDDITAFYICNEFVPRTENTFYFNTSRTTSLHKNYVENIVNWLKQNTRNFNFKIIYTNLVDVERTKKISIYLAEYAVTNINNNIYDKYIDGNSKDADGWYFKQTPTYTFYDYFKTNATRGSYEFPCLNDTYNTAVAMVELPQALFDLTVSCDSFKNDDSNNQVPCGHCYKCVSNMWYQSKLSANQTPSQITSYINSKSNQSNGSYISMKLWLKNEPNITSEIYTANEDRKTEVWDSSPVYPPVTYTIS
jgi:hypothetical protein